MGVIAGSSSRERTSSAAPEPPPGSPPADFSPPAAAWTHDVLAGRSERAQRTRRVLLCAAAQRFEVEGYHATSLADILSDTGLTKGALYHHFDSKHRLAEALVAEVVDGWVGVEGLVADRSPDPLWRLLLETDSAVANWTHDPLRRAFHRLLHDSDTFAGARTDWEQRREAAVIRHLAQARDLGLLRAGAEPVMLGRQFRALFAGHRALSVAMPAAPDLWDRMSDTMRSLLPFTATDAWLVAWRRSGWETRPRPDPAIWIAARAVG